MGGAREAHLLVLLWLLGAQERTVTWQCPGPLGAIRALNVTFARAVVNVCFQHLQQKVLLLMTLASGRACVNHPAHWSLLLQGPFKHKIGFLCLPDPSGCFYRGCHVLSPVPHHIPTILNPHFATEGLPDRSNQVQRKAGLYGLTRNVRLALHSEHALAQPGTTECR